MTISIGGSITRPDQLGLTLERLSSDTLSVTASFVGQRPFDLSHLRNVPGAPALSDTLDRSPLGMASIGTPQSFDLSRLRDVPGTQALSGFMERAQAIAIEQPARFTAILRDTFGDKLTPGAAAALTSRIAAGDLPRPAVRFVDDDVLGGALGAYSPAEGGVIFLNAALRSDPAALRQVMAQEMGHHLDAVLGGPDTRGDEGRAFAMALDKGAPLSPAEKALASAVPDHGVIEIGGRRVAVEFALPAIAIWLGQGALQTAPDILIGEIMEQLTGVPYTWIDKAIDFGANLLPGVGQVDTTRKLAKLGEAIDDVVRATRLADRLPTAIAGKADAAARTIAREWDTFRGHVASGNWERAGQSWGSLIGRVREMQVASRISESGGTLVDFGATFRQGARQFEIDVVFRDAHGRMVAGEVKTGGDVRASIGSDRFQRTLDRFVEQRDAVRARYGADTEFRVYADDISRDMASALSDAGISVVRNPDLLR